MSPLSNNSMRGTRFRGKSGPHLQQPVLSLNHEPRKPSRADMSLSPLDDLHVMAAAMVSVTGSSAGSWMHDMGQTAAHGTLLLTSTSCVVNGRRVTALRTLVPGFGRSRPTTLPPTSTWNMLLPRSDASSSLIFSSLPWNRALHPATAAGRCNDICHHSFVHAQASCAGGNPQ